MTALGRYNANAAEGSGITPSHIGASSWDDISTIKTVQQDLQVTPDGWFGPVSLTAFKLALVFKSVGLVVDRQKYRTENHRRRKRPAEPISLVWHDSVTRTARDCHRVLEHRGLSTHYMIPEDPRDPVYQCADPGSTWCLHAGAFNQESIGIDVISLLDPSYLSRLRPSDRARKARIVARAWSCSKLRPQVIDMTESQRARVKLLARALHLFFKIPMQIPHDVTAYGSKVDGVVDTLYHGSIAHSQWSSKRWDGILVQELLIESGWSDVNVE